MDNTRELEEFQYGAEKYKGVFHRWFDLGAVLCAVVEITEGGKDTVGRVILLTYEQVRFSKPWDLQIKND
jgi:hypothetical protein